MVTQNTARPGVPARPPAPPPAAPTPPADLVCAYRQVLEHEAEKGLPSLTPVSKWHRFGRPVAGIAAVLVSLWLWIMPPAWLDPAPKEMVVWPEGESGSHLLLINAADAIEQFREASGRLPTGAELDSVAPVVSLRPLPDGGFELHSPDGRTLTAPAPWARSALGYELSAGTEEAAP